MDKRLRELQRQAAEDPSLQPAYEAELRRLGRYRLLYTGPEPPQERVYRNRQAQKGLKATDPWICGTKGYGKRSKSRGGRRFDKSICRDWLYYWDYM